mmetsp:Transcript_2040/g.3195  ORF Transcript_2040/g.3195 Transcript_2040/m.3195 type:complete len:260 (+) Transcript_2040:678-1457(+)
MFRFKAMTRMGWSTTTAEMSYLRQHVKYPAVQSPDKTSCLIVPRPSRSAMHRCVQAELLTRSIAACILGRSLVTHSCLLLASKVTTPSCMEMVCQAAVACAHQPRQGLGFRNTMTTESPRKNILLTNRSLFTARDALLPFPVLGISVHISVTFSKIMLQWRSNALTRASSLWLLRQLMSTCELVLTLVVSTESGPVLNSSSSFFSNSSTDSWAAIAAAQGKSYLAVGCRVGSCSQDQQPVPPDCGDQWLPCPPALHLLL